MYCSKDLPTLEVGLEDLGLVGAAQTHGLVDVTLDYPLLHLCLESEVRVEKRTQTYHRNLSDSPSPACSHSLGFSAPAPRTARRGTSAKPRVLTRNPSTKLASAFFKRLFLPSALLRRRSGWWRAPGGHQRRVDWMPGRLHTVTFTLLSSRSLTLPCPNHECSL